MPRFKPHGWLTSIGLLSITLSQSSSLPLHTSTSTDDAAMSANAASISAWLLTKRAVPVPPAAAIALSEPSAGWVQTWLMHWYWKPSQVVPQPLLLTQWQTLP